ncbi:hypothetical protein GOBAR_AA08364 [Gossypium barbadense]|uniref:NB-ARC domain-containing protein n=1 Tax=Gossypium barbadense TaxID=3634 RepID=A0A2P5Y9M5_GOSBA|nr:hypothetical protein GOBAR_AA08364 [Gossypium barbadense]
MAEAIVSLSVERISDLLIHEAVFLKDVKDQVESLKDELKRMKCFLEDIDRIPEQDKCLHNRVSEIQNLAYDAEDVKAIQTKLQNISRNLPAYAIPGDEEGSSSIFKVQQRLKTYSHVKEEDVVSLEVSTKEIMAKLMIEEDRLHIVVSVVGMGSIGKITFARKVYNHVDVRRHFDFLAWVYISQQCKPRKVLLSVLMKVLSPSKDERELIEKLDENELWKSVEVSSHARHTAHADSNT